MIMKKQIKLSDRALSYTLRVSRRARRLRIAVYCDASVVVTAPIGLPQNFVERFIIQKTGWILRKVEHFSKVKIRPRIITRRGDYKKYKNQALELVTRKVEQFNKTYHFSYKRVTIKNQKTRWGSCSKKGNLNFNYKIVFLPEPLVDYLIVHELCHLGEFNHSSKFWELVSRTVPDFKSLKKRLHNEEIAIA